MGLRVMRSERGGEGDAIMGVANVWADMGSSCL